MPLDVFQIERNGRFCTVKCVDGVSWVAHMIHATRIGYERVSDAVTVVWSQASPQERYTVTRCPHLSLSMFPG